MKHHKKILAAALLTVATSSAQALEEINFESQTVGNFGLPLSSLTIDDVTFTSLSGLNNNGLGSFIINDFSPTGEITPDYSGKYLANGGRGFSSLEISFASAVSEFSFNLGGNTADWTLEAFDSGDNFLSDLTITGIPSSSNNNGDFFGLSSSSNAISYAILSLSTPPSPSAFIVDSIELDNLRYTPTSPIPEPSTYALMLGGLGMVGFMAYRRRKQMTA